jgi:putative nucleotidyltransferase with HDIG domain
MSSFKLPNTLSWRDLLTRVALVVISVTVIVTVLPHDHDVNFKIEKGKPWRYADFTAPFDFPIYKSDEVVKAERDSMLRQYEPYYDYVADQESKSVRQFTKDYGQGIPNVPSDYISIIANRLHQLYSQGIMNADDYQKISRDTTAMIRIVRGKNAISVPVTRVLSTVSAYEHLFADPALAEHQEQLRKCNLNDYIQENIVYDKERSEASLRDLMSSIPLATGVVQRGQKIIDRGSIVDDKTYNTLQSFIKESDRRQKSDAQLSMTLLGQIIYVGLLMIAFTLFLSLSNNDYLEKIRSAAMIYALIVVFAVVASLLVSHNVLHVYIIPFAIVPIFIRVFMDSRTAFMAHVTLVLICACILQRPLDFVAVEVLGGLVAIFSLRELSSRSQLFWTAIAVTAVGAATNLSLELIRANSMAVFDMSDYRYLIISGVILFCTYPLLYIIEKAFGFTSNITLIELSDMNKELLRRMSEVAPGTFQHSIQVGNLAAEIANKIGAKSQLVRTGALYHDIGKIQNPIYFTENQSGYNPHDGLTYVESAQMIISHVTEGMKLADKYNLPDIISRFIATHHGLGKAKYFYVKQKNEFPDEPVDDLLFTYPGPNPTTKEQAILMMADSVEAASRSLPDYSEKSIRELVEHIIDGQVADGFFRDCPITFRDIQYAKTVLIEKLKTIYHTRISYPEMKK